MNTETTEQRVAERGPMGGAVTVVRVTTRSFWDWIEKRHIPAHAVIAVTIYMTVRIAEWAMYFKTGYPEVSGSEAAFFIGAVTGPWVLLQAAMFKFYAESIKSNGTQP